MTYVVLLKDVILHVRDLYGRSHSDAIRCLKRIENRATTITLQHFDEEAQVLKQVDTFMYCPAAIVQPATCVIERTSDGQAMIRVSHSPSLVRREARQQAAQGCPPEITQEATT